MRHSPIRRKRVKPPSKKAREEDDARIDRLRESMAKKRERADGSSHNASPGGVLRLRIGDEPSEVMAVTTKRIGQKAWVGLVLARKAVEDEWMAVHVSRQYPRHSLAEQAALDMAEVAVVTTANLQKRAEQAPEEARANAPEGDGKEAAE